MGILDAMPMSLIALLIFFLFWVAIPGLITGWMLREAGGSFARWFFLGATCGPLGIVAALGILFIANRRGKDIRAGATGARTRRPRMSYDVPLVGRLHASTVWMLAGFATFVCVWVLGGVGYELYLHQAQEGEKRAAQQAATNGSAPQRASALAETVAAQPTFEPSSNIAVAGKPSPPHAPVLGAAAPQSSSSGQATMNAPFDSSSQMRPPTFGATDAARSVAPSAEAPSAQPVAAPERRATEAPATSKPPVHAPEAVISELKQNLGSRGYRVHAALSGSAQTATLSLSGATLTKELGNQLLGSRRTREALKASGIRIVVLINGQDSWAFML
ncbi:MAG TPA: hypothetical protein VM934_17420 [Pyrinomonadaceae bacterium]|nr:hypothetical protein [Pyrinomonadaceae bacterium]